ncbi:MAG TPA: lytic transglycosylase domain-containing protein [Bryobacteraceae bacterium]|nr:lytic transglycosylase domain-containing protein [Bryobacteraceae bacterium]
MKLKAVLLLSFAAWGQAGSPEYFFPSHRISGVGVERDDLTPETLQLRTDLMVQSQTFVIMREQEAIAGARRVTAPALQSIIRSAARSSGFPQSILEAIIYLESWGDANSPTSPAGAKGIMQITDATAKDMGLSVVHATRYHVTKERVLVKSRNKSTKPRYKTITHREPYTVLVRDDRMIPDRAIPAAARYLARLERTFGAEDWAIFAYHCGTGCVTFMKELTSRAQGIPPDEITVARMFFSCSPNWNRELYQAIQQQMLRDYSPTYYFRILRAAQLLAIYRQNPDDLAALQLEYKNQFASGRRAPHMLSTWLRPDDLIYRTGDDIRANPGSRLIKALDNADYLGYTLQLPSSDAFADSSEASPAALGTLTYIAFETRRLLEERSSPGESFQPLPVVALVESEDYARQQLSQHDALQHSSGEVFDLDIGHLPAGELECLRFVLDDLGWSGYLGFVEDGAGRMHIGCSPNSREFFSNVWQEAQEHLAVN